MKKANMCLKVCDYKYRKGERSNVYVEKQCVCCVTMQEVCWCWSCGVVVNAQALIMQMDWLTPHGTWVQV